MLVKSAQVVQGPERKLVGAEAQGLRETVMRVRRVSSQPLTPFSPPQVSFLLLIRNPGPSSPACLLELNSFFLLQGSTFSETGSPRLCPLRCVTSVTVRAAGGYALAQGQSAQEGGAGPACGGPVATVECPRGLEEPLAGGFSEELRWPFLIPVWLSVSNRGG